MESQITVLPGIDELPLSEPQLLFFNQNKKMFNFNIDDNNNSSDEFFVKGVWTKSEDELLKEAISEFQNTNIDWNIVALKVPHRSSKQCKERWTYRLQPSVKKIPFEKWEDEIVVKERLKFGNHWTLIARKLPGRTAVAVKNRWYSVLRHRYHGLILDDFNPRVTQSRR
ncbi:hypothetical protein M9Y10_023445 [Tritrichomonas musculus]|uniref:Myb-like DNA-binding domain containing protein n=1 Tax=Tritrichomonas musculus TaxID=1915356 RepID=A0ABR2KVB5_9EUKA